MEHPITPPPNKFKRWEDDILNDRQNVDVVLDCAWKDGYRAGADAELEACCHLLRQQGFDVVDDLRNARRPKPPSLAEEGLEALKRQAVRSVPSLVATNDCGVIRAALERLKELESGND